MNVIYPAVFHYEDGSYWVEFPDLEGCQSFGDTLIETMENAKEALSGYCLTLVEQGRRLPKPSELSAIKHNGTLAIVEARIMTSARSVKKTLTIPAWLNRAAEEQHINFSETLQNALVEKLNA